MIIAYTVGVQFDDLVCTRLLSLQFSVSWRYRLGYRRYIVPHYFVSPACLPLDELSYNSVLCRKMTMPTRHIRTDHQL
jgi:hypothetical protein